MHIEAESQEIWPPEMQMEILREEYNSKQMEWQTTLDTAHWKYMKLRDTYYELLLKSEELTTQVKESEEKIAYFEEKSIVDENDICILKEQIELKDRELENSVGIARDEVVVNEEEIVADEEEVEAIVDETTKEEKEITDEESMKVEINVEELEETIAALETENENAKKYMQDMRERADEKRKAIQKIVEEEREKKQTIKAKLESSQAQMSKLEQELVTSKKEIEGLKKSIAKNVEEAAIRQKEEEERAKMFSKESLDIATAAVRQAEERENKLKQQLQRTNKKMKKFKVENVELHEKVDELEASIEKDMEIYNENMELLRLENDWKLEINELDSQLQQVRENRDVLFEEGLRLREALNEKTKRYLLRMESSQAKWDDLLLNQKNEHETVVSDLNSEIAMLQKTIEGKDAVIQNLSKNNQTSELGCNAEQTTTKSAVEVVKNVPETTKPKRFRTIRRQFAKVKQWVGRKLRRN